MFRQNIDYKKIVDIFKSVPVQRYFSKDFLNDEFIDYLIKNIYFMIIFYLTIIREWNISYFNFRLMRNICPFIKFAVQNHSSTQSIFTKFTILYSDYLTLQLTYHLLSL